MYVHLHMQRVMISEEYLSQKLRILKFEHFLRIDCPYITRLYWFGSFRETVEKSCGMAIK